MKTLRRTPQLAFLLTLWLATVPLTFAGQSTGAPSPIPGPSFEDVISLEDIGSVTVSEDGAAIAYTVTTTDWNENQFTTQIWLARADGNSEPFQLTRGSKSSRSPQFAPNGTRLAFLTDRGEGQQVFVIDTRGGEATAATDFEGSIGSFHWSRDGSRIAFVASETENPVREARKDAYGDYAGEDEDFTYSHLWVIDVGGTDPEGAKAHEPTQLTTGTDFTVGSFDWSPDGTLIAFDHRPRPVIDDFVSTDISLVEMSTRTVRPLMNAAPPEARPLFSPDGKRVAFASNFNNNPYYGNTLLATVSVGWRASNPRHRAVRRERICVRLDSARALVCCRPTDRTRSLQASPRQQW